MISIRLALCLFLLVAVRGEDAGNEDEAKDDEENQAKLDEQKLLNMFHIPKDYDKFDTPYCPDLNITTVQIGLVPVAIGDVSLKLMIFEVQLFIVLEWNDCRLTIPEVDLSVHSEKVIEELWFPPIKFFNCMQCNLIHYDSTSDFFYISYDMLHVEILRTQKLNCKYDLRAYPLEVQRCYVKIISDDTIDLLDFKLIKFKWTSKLVSDISPQEFKIETISASLCPNVQQFGLDYACVALYFDMRREVKFHLIVSYIPSVFLVMLSWISFWLDPTVASPRVALGVTTMLALVTQFISTQKDLPSVAYVKAIDVWMFGCMALVFSSLVEFAIANFLNRAKDSNAVIPKPNIIRYCRIGPVKPGNSSLKLDSQRRSKQNQINLLPDRISRIVFPIVFVIFKICYWSYYLKHNRPTKME